MGHSHLGLTRRVPHWSAVDGVALTYLVDIVFADFDDDPAPVASPVVGRTGQLVLTDSGNRCSISGGKFVTSGSGSANTLADSSRSRAAGLAAYIGGYEQSISGVRRFDFYSQDEGFYLYRQGNRISAYDNNILSPDLDDIGDGQYSALMILRNIGGFHFWNNQLIWIGDAGDNTTGTIQYRDATAANDSLGIIRVIDLLSNGYGVFGVRDLDLCTPGTGTGTSKIAAPAAGNTGVMTPDALITFDVSAPTGTTTVLVRVVDASNYDQISIDASGNLTYDEVVGGVPNNLITAAGVISGGEKISAVMIGGDVLLYHDDTLSGSTSSATSNIAGDSFELDVEGDPVTNLIARTLDGVANVGSANHPGYGLATNVLPGPRAAADTFTHEADCLINFDMPAIPPAGTLEFWFRSATVGVDGWRVTVDSSGDVDLDEVVSGTPTQRGTSAAAVSGGERVLIICADETIIVCADVSLLISYSSAVTQKTQTAGEIEALGTGGQISNVVTYPRSFSSAPNTGGASEAATALALLGAS